MLRKRSGSKTDRRIVVLRALAHPVRWKMLQGLCRSECNVSRIWQRLGISQPLASQHLNSLRRAGLVKTERRGQSICYQMADPRLADVLERIAALFPDD